MELVLAYRLLLACPTLNWKGILVPCCGNLSQTVDLLPPRWPAITALGYHTCIYGAGMISRCSKLGWWTLLWWEASLISSGLVLGHVGKFHINWRHLWGFSPTNWRHTYHPATSPVCKMLYFVALAGSSWCALEFLGRIRVSFWLHVTGWWYVSMCVQGSAILCRHLVASCTLWRTDSACSKIWNCK